MRINLYDLGYVTYHVAISFDSGISSSRSYEAFSKSPTKAAEQTLDTIGRELPTSGTLLIYQYTFCHKLPWQKPNKLVQVLDYRKKELFLVPWSLHHARTAPRWQQLPLTYEPNGSPFNEIGIV